MSEASTIVNDEEEESENSDVVIKIENDNISEKASTDEPWDRVYWSEFLSHKASCMYNIGGATCL